MKNFLIIYSSTDGHTKVICENIASHLNKVSITSKIFNIDNVPTKELVQADHIVIGASIRYGKFNAQLSEFIDEHLAILQATPSSFFCVNAVARKSNKNTPETNPYMQNFLEKTLWKPHTLGVFAGKINYPNYKRLDKVMIQFIMWLTRGPTDTSKCYELTDWKHVYQFSKQLASTKQSF